MQLIDFSQFARRRAAGRQQAHDVTMTEAPDGDRWFQLHSKKPEHEINEGMAPDVDEADFWGDLQFRLAYPTHRLRTH
jgi:hypothetical protein